MGRRANMGTACAGARVQVHALHPTDDDTRRCALRFSAHGLLLESDPDPDPDCDPGSDRGSGSSPERLATVLLRVPWWTIHGFAADEAVRRPDGELVQALDVHTDAGTLRLALPAAEVVVALSMLSAHARRWRRCRLAPLRWAARSAARVAPVVAPVVASSPAPSLARARRVAASLGGESIRALRRRPAVALTVGAVAALTLASGTVAVAAGQRHNPVHPLHASTAGAGPTVAISGMSRLVAEAHVREGIAGALPPAAAPPPPAPPSITKAPALSPHEVFGFVPYWMLGEEASFDVSGYTTLAYFAVPVNGDGTLQQSGTGWDGYESQALADLVARADAAGVRVVLTVNCFSVPALDELTSSPAARQTLATSVLAAVAAKNLDGVNLDFEGGSPAERAGLSALVTTVATAVHAANPRYQVTVDTDGDSASDPSTFYDVRALASAADGLFVMAYGLNYGAAPDAASPITSGELSDVEEAAAYAAAVPPGKVIFGTSFFGYSWATTNGTMAARSTATGTPVTYAQVVASGHPVYWDPVTETAWTSYETAGQWHEDYVDDPASVYLVASLAAHEGFGGVGVWALGMDGNDPEMTAALDGKAPVEHAALAGPDWTPASTSKVSKRTSGVRPEIATPRPLRGTSTSTTSTSTSTTSTSTTTPTTTTPTTTTPTTTTTATTTTTDPSAATTTTSTVPTTDPAASPTTTTTPSASATPTTTTTTPTGVTPPTQSSPTQRG